MMHSLKYSSIINSMIPTNKNAAKLCTQLLKVIQNSVKIVFLGIVESYQFIMHWFHFLIRSKYLSDQLNVILTQNYL